MRLIFKPKWKEGLYNYSFRFCVEFVKLFTHFVNVFFGWEILIILIPQWYLNKLKNYFLQIIIINNDIAIHAC